MSRPVAGTPTSLVRRLVRVALSALAGMVVVSTTYLYLSAAPTSSAGYIVSSRSEAVRQAVEQGGRLRWPGTTVKEVDRTDVGGGSFVVERRWLGLKESAVRVNREGTGWTLDYSTTYGPGEALQFLLGSLLPGAAVAWLVYARVGRRRRHRSSAAA